jgi:ferric-dicitrate binding protein FerR (iron transport regulator)
MDCEQALDLLLAHMDRELAPEQRPPLEAHLQACAACRADADAFRQQDADLRRAFAPRRRAASAVADRVISQLRPSPARSRLPVPWLPILLSTAAGFLLALVIFRPWTKPPVEIVTVPGPGMETAAKTLPPRVLVTVASRPVELLPPGSTRWEKVAQGSHIELGSRVRTDPLMRCELQTPDGSEVRLDTATEVVVGKDRQLELIRGQILARAQPAPSPLRVAVPEATIAADRGEFDVICSPAKAVLTVLDGATQVRGKDQERTVHKGQAADIVQGKVNRIWAEENLTRATSWVTELLLLKGGDSPELIERVDDILAQIGEAKMNLPQEEIRRLGDHCVLPLTRYLESPRSHGLRAEHRRRLAADILADLAQPWSIPDLIRLLKDDDGEVRVCAARGLQRLTNLSFSVEPEAWRRGDGERLDNAYQQWQTWWQENKYRCPGVS